MLRFAKRTVIHVVLALVLLGATVYATSEWTSLGTWSGDGTKETESFTTTQKEWRVRWSQKGEGGFLAITVMNAKDDIVGNAGSSSSGESYVRTPPGKHYLKIASAGNHWTITAEEQR